MSRTVRHVMGISGGKDSAALAIYLKDKYPHLNIEYYFCDTGKELKETYQLIKNLEIYLGEKIVHLKAIQGNHETPFDHFYKFFDGYLPAANARWCTKMLKLIPFEKFVGDDPVVSYVGIRGDEDREGYISRKPNIQSIFPFRRNIWSEDVIDKVLKNINIPTITKICKKTEDKGKLEKILELVNKPLSVEFKQAQKLNVLLDFDVTAFNKIVFEFLKNTDYPLALKNDYQLVENEDVLVRDDIFKILKESGVGVPGYYQKIEFSLNGEKGEYARSRSGCFFCFFQQKIEWVWLYEQHSDLFKSAMEYEKNGFTWTKDERLEDLIKPERIQQIKKGHLKKSASNDNKKSPYLIDILVEAEGEGCTACFI